jgi:hypothetical protein
MPQGCFCANDEKRVLHRSFDPNKQKRGFRKACIAREKDNYVLVIETWVNIKDKDILMNLPELYFFFKKHV